MKIKKNDKVKIICGKDKGKEGKVLTVSIKKGKLTVEGLNLSIKHARPRKQGETGQRIQYPVAMDVSNVRLICPKCNKPTRIGYKILANKKKVRICRKCMEIIE